MQLIPDTPLEFGYAVWQMRPPQWSLTVVLKATYVLVPDGPCALADEQSPVSAEVHHGDDPAQSLKSDTDLAIFKPRGECTLAGTAHAPGGRPVTALAVGFRVGPVKRALAVVGDRARPRSRDAVPSAPEPFVAMPLRWEKSFGGEGSLANPVGVGLAPVSTPEGARWPMPNLEDPAALITAFHANTPPAGLFPIPRGWPARAALSGTYGATWQKTRAPFFPDDFDYEYFNAAPLEQRIRGYWQGDEEITLEHLDASLPVLHSRLPGLRARCFLTSPGPRATRFREVPLALDTIAVDADTRRVTCIFRGVTEVADDQLSDVAEVYTVHEPADAAASLEACRARFERKLDALASEDEEFAPEAAPQALTPGDGSSAVALAAGELEVALERLDPEATTRLSDDEIEALERLAHDRRTLRGEVTAKLARGESVAGEDLTGADLSELDLTGVDFTRAILVDASLRAATLDDARFDRALLTGADLTAVRARRASFRGAELSRGRCAGADLAEAALDGAVAHGADLANAILGRASLRGAELEDARLDGADLRGADLTGADLSGANLTRANLTGATLADATLNRCVADGVVMDDADVTNLRASDGARFADGSFRSVRGATSHWDGAHMERADLSFADLERADFSGADLTGATLNGCNLKRARFAGATLVRATMLKSDAFEALFEAADLAHADLRGSSFFAAEFWRARTHSARLELANVERTRLAHE